MTKQAAVVVIGSLRDNLSSDGVFSCEDSVSILIQTIISMLNNFQVKHAINIIFWGSIVYNRSKVYIHQKFLKVLVHVTIIDK